MAVNTTAVINLKLNADGVERDAKQLGEKMKRSLGGVLQGVGQGIGQAGFDQLAGSLREVGGFVADSTLQFEKFRTVLTTTLGSTALADKALESITSFAAKTPFELSEVLSAFIKLKSRGIEPTEEALTNLGDITASQGKGLNQITEAILDGATGQFERLREFGIVATSAGDRVSLSFKGVTTEVAKTPEALSAAILGFGKLEGVAGGMASLSATLGGQLSNLTDTAAQAAVAFGSELVPALLTLVTSFNQNSGGIAEFAKSLGEGTAAVLDLAVSALKLAADNGELLSTVIQALTLRFAALKAIALAQSFQAAAIQMGVLTASGGLASVSLSGVAAASQAATAALAPLAVALAPLALLVGAIALTKFATELNESATAIAGSLAGVEAAASGAFAAANRTKAATDSLNTARSAGRQLTAGEISDSKKLIAANQLRLKGLAEDLAAAEDLNVSNDVFGRRNEEQFNTKAQLIQQTKSSIAALQGQNEKLKESASASGIETDATKQATAAQKDKRTALEQISDSYDKQIAAAENANQASQAGTAEALAAGNITEDAARQQNLDSERAYLAERLALNEQKLGELRALQSKATSSEDIQKAGEAVLSAEAQVSGDRLKLAQNGAEQRKAVEEAAVKELAIAETEAQTAIATARASGSITDGEANIQRLAATRDRIAGELALELKGAADKQKIAQLELQLVENAAAQQEAIEVESLNRIAKATEEANRQIEASQNERIAAVKQAQLDNATTEEEAARQIADIQRSGTGERVQAVEDELEALRAARAAGTVDTETGAEKEAELIEQLGQLSLQRLDDELEARKAVQEEAIAAIQKELAASDRATRRKIAGLERQTEAQEGVEASLQRQSDLLSSQADLAQALSNLDEVRAQGSVDRLSRAVEIQARLNSGEVESAQVRRALEQELAGLGVSRGESSLTTLKRQQDEEDRLATIQRAALASKQIQERASLDLETRRNEIASARQVIEAKIAEIQARQNENAAQSALREAQLTGDAEQIAAAEVDLELAQQSTDLAGEVVSFAEENVLAQAAIATNANAALTAQQQSEISLSNQNELARQFANNLERAELASNGTRVGGSPQARRDGGEVKAGAPYLVGEAGPELITPRRSGWVWTAQQTAEMLRSHVPKGFTSGVALQSGDRSSELLREIKGLRADLKLDFKTLDRPQQNNNFTLVNEEDPYDKVVKTTSALLRGRIQSLGL